MTEFISDMGHILVTPIATITGAASILRYGYAEKYLEIKPLLEDILEGCTAWEKAYIKL